MKKTQKVYRIHLQGQVQGVGFRPFVYKLAKEFELCGWVNNSVDGVHIEFNAAEELGDAFFQAVQKRAPVLARITAADMIEAPWKIYTNFEIRNSEETGEANLLLTPDVALCRECRMELHDPANRRFCYPFITCTNCGPRYSIIQKLPYDRPYTTMKAFPMCMVCATEYEEPLNRRYYSQTNSCTVCGIALQWHSKEEGSLEGDDSDLINRAVAYILAGKIVAVKGIGGFLLCCDAGNEKAVMELRMRKHRPSKPFALMYPSLEMLTEEALVSSEEAWELTGSAAPILLLELKNDRSNNLAISAIAPGLNQIGAMLPYAPLFERLLHQLQRPIVATSGNRSNAPIVFDNATALRELPEIADALLCHNRDIVTPQDDSVIRFTPRYRQRIVLRRSRGLAPTFIQPELLLPDKSVLAMGAQLKSAFALTHKGNLYLSQYLGDLENYDTERSFQLTIKHLTRLFSARPEAVLTDPHPDYFSTRLGQQLAAEWNVPVIQYQHHRAHFAAVLAENNLLQEQDPILGVIWDGTGLGDDGQVWGGEFFLFDGNSMPRVAQLGYFPFILGNKMPREPRISALATCGNVPEAKVLLEPHFSRTEWSIYNRLLSKEDNLHSSSMGRLFDAAAALLGLSLQSSYEGEAAMLLENAALRVFQQIGYDGLPGLLAIEKLSENLPPQALLQPIAAGVLRGEPAGELAARFHRSLVDWVEHVARCRQVGRIAFSGGVFQNAVLTDLLIHRLQHKFSLYFHRELSPNDENIAFGQVMLAGGGERRCMQRLYKQRT
ncbi:MAG: carbamoyltransferase HypF [Saprospiraceae bacterium]|nr:carbamoyltransferase HypF [Saprospiraceae bacterium]